MRTLEQQNIYVDPIADEMILFSDHSRFARYVKIYSEVLKKRGAEFLVAVFDNDGAPHDERLNRIKDSIKKYPNIQVVTAPGVAVEEVEAWLLADVVAVGKILSISINEPPSPETIEDPKEYLDKIFASSPKLVKDLDLYSDIAGELNKNNLLTKCKSFKRFHDEILQIICKK